MYVAALPFGLTITVGAMHVAGSVNCPLTFPSPFWARGAGGAVVPTFVPLQKSEAVIVVTGPAVPALGPVAKTSPRTRTLMRPSLRSFASPRPRSQSTPPGLTPKMTIAGAAGVPALLGRRFWVIR